MRITVAICLVVSLSACSLGREEKSEVSVPQAETFAAADSVLMEITFRGANPIASKLFYSLKKNGVSNTDLYRYTHRLKDNKLILMKKTVPTTSTLHQVIKNERELLKKAEAMDGYQVHWLDGDYWSIAIHDNKGERTYSYPELYQQPDTPEIEQVKKLINQLDREYEIEKGRWDLKLKKGKYTNHGGEVMEIK
ncbi:hypothetical protein D1627_00980 [Pontibacter oryzae]|uniref:Uncharacterized protein n=2 Tax=Pontibacter oryzae TaxID=2304593 RepID=A0A399SHI0_9BACT|nr:hypothetical protein D1627_00980 [Pontibacter oryzae]